MQRRFFSNLTLIFLLNGLIKPIWIFGIDRKVQLVLGSVQYGTYYSLLSLAMILNIVLDIGITNYVNREVARQPDIVKDYFGPLLLIKGALAFLYTGLVFLLAYIIKIPSGTLLILTGIVVLQTLLSLLQFVRAHVSGMHLFVKDSFLSIFDKAIVIIVCGILLYLVKSYDKFSIVFFIIVQILALLLSIVLGIIIVLKHINKIKFKVNMALTKAILIESRPYAIMVLLMAAYNRLDGVMLERLAGAAVAGQYAKDFRMLDACGQFGVLFAGLLLPMFVRMLRENKSINTLAGSAFSMLYAMAIVIAVISTAYAANIHNLLYHDNSHSVLNIIMWAFIGNAGMYVFSSILTANGDIKSMIGLAIAGVAANISINAFITPANGAWVAATACVFTQYMVSTIAILLCYKNKLISLNLNYWLKLIFFTIYAGILASISIKIVHNFYIAVGFITIFAGIGIFLLRIVTPSQVRELIRKPSF